MANPNFNAGAQGNSLDALLNGRPLWGNAGGLLYLTNGNGSNGFNTGSYSPDGSTPAGVLTTDPRYFYQTTLPGSEGGGGDRVWELNPQAQAALNGRVQLKNTTIGGPGGVRDPSKVTYDPEFGLVTDPSNLNPLGETFLDKYGPWLLAAPGFAAVGAAAAAGVGTGAGGAGAAGLTGSSALTTGGFGTDIAAGSGAFDAAAGAGAGSAATTGGFDANGVWHDVPTMNNVQAGTLNPMGPDPTPLGTSPSGGGFDANGVWHDIPQMDPIQDPVLNPMGPDPTPLNPSGHGLLDQAANWVKENPLRALGLAQTAYGLLGGHGHGPSSSSSSSGSKGGNGTGNSNFTVPQRQFYVNPYIQAQINRGYGQ